MGVNVLLLNSDQRGIIAGKTVGFCQRQTVCKCQIVDPIQGGFHNGIMTICQVLGPSALWIADLDDPALAVELYSLACQHPCLAKARWFEDIYGHPIYAQAERLPTEALAVAKERGRARDLWQTADQLLEEFSSYQEDFQSEHAVP